MNKTRHEIDSKYTNNLNTTTATIPAIGCPCSEESDVRAVRRSISLPTDTVSQRCDCDPGSPSCAGRIGVNAGWVADTVAPVSIPAGPTPEHPTDPCSLLLCWSSASSWSWRTWALLRGWRSFCTAADKRESVSDDRK